MELPEQIFIDKIKADIGRLISEQPVPSQVVDGQSGQVQQVMKPSVEPDKDYFAGKWDLVIGQIVRYGVKNWQELPPGSPADVQLRGYLKLATMYMQMEKLAGVAGPALLDSGAPGWAGSLGKPSPTGKSAAPGAGQ